MLQADFPSYTLDGFLGVAPEASLGSYRGKHLLLDGVNQLMADLAIAVFVPIRTPALV